MLSLVFLIASLVLFIVSALGVSVGRVNLLSAGLACYVASLLVGRMVA